MTRRDLTTVGPVPSVGSSPRSPQQGRARRRSQAAGAVDAAGAKAASYEPPPMSSRSFWSASSRALLLMPPTSYRRARWRRWCRCRTSRRSPGTAGTSPLEEQQGPCHTDPAQRAQPDNRLCRLDRRCPREERRLLLGRPGSARPNRRVLRTALQVEYRSRFGGTRWCSALRGRIAVVFTVLAATAPDEERGGFIGLAILWFAMRAGAISIVIAVRA